MTDEYEQAIKIVEKWLRDLEPEPISKGEENVFEKEVRSLLSLTWPSGQRVIGVLSRDQRLPDSEHAPSLIASMHSLYQREGFRRVLLPEEKCPALKQEEKK